MSRYSLVLLCVLSLLAALSLQLVQLPYTGAKYMPLWLPITLAYWAIYGRNYPVLSAGFILGLCVDVATNSPFGQHALGLVLVAYVCTKFRLTIGRFPLFIQAFILLGCFLGYALLLFILDGMAHHLSTPEMRFIPALTSALVWPLFCLLIELFRGKSENT